MVEGHAAQSLSAVAGINGSSTPDAGMHRMMTRQEKDLIQKLESPSAATMPGVVGRAGSAAQEDDAIFCAASLLLFLSIMLLCG